MLPSSQIPKNDSAIPTPPTPRPKSRYRLRPPGEPLQSVRKSSQLAQVSTQYNLNPFTIVTNPDQLRKACAALQQAEAIGLDCETTELDPYKGELRLTQLSTDQHTYVIDHRRYGPSGYEPLAELLEAPKPRTICHHSKFEQKWLLHKLGIRLGGIFDSMLASQLIDYGQKSHNLATVAKIHLGIEVDKTLQKSNWSGDLSEEQIRYAVRDSQILPELRRVLVRRLSQEHLIRAAQLEFETVPVVAAIELAGIFLDIDRWKEQLSLVTQQHLTLAAELQEMLAAGASQATLFGDHPLINLDSHPEILTALKLLNVPVDRSTKNNVLLPLANEFPVVAKLLEYRPLSKALTSYGESWFSAINPVTNRVHPEFAQLGAPTGRFSCSDPNVQQVPHANGYRRCFRAPAGRKFCIVDYSQIELRIIAEFSQDPGFVAAFRSGADLHKTTASQVFNVSIDQVTPEQRDFAKRLNFGVVYGIGAPRFANMTGMSLTQAETTLRRYFETYQQLDTYLVDTANQALEDRMVRTGSGRIVRYRYDPKDKQQKNSTKRKARNARIQGTGADIFKRALRLVGDELRGTTAQIVNIIHDEIIVEADDFEAEHIGERVSARMVQAAEEYIKTIPVKAEPQITTEWIKD